MSKKFNDLTLVRTLDEGLPPESTEAGMLTGKGIVCPGISLNNKDACKVCLSSPDLTPPSRTVSGTESGNGKVDLEKSLSHVASACWYGYVD